MHQSKPKLLAHMRSILALPFMVLVIIPGIICLALDAAEFKIGIPAWIRWILAIAFTLPGLWLFITTLRLFHHRGKGTLAPWDPPKHLVIEGPYRFVRNPMISGVFLLLVAESLWFSSWFILVWSICFFLINHFYFIFREEPQLRQRFGDSYIRYCEHVSRWLPHFKPWSP